MIGGAPLSCGDRSPESIVVGMRQWQIRERSHSPTSPIFDERGEIILLVGSATAQNGRIEWRNTDEQGD
jgi:hypothetical protein